MQNTGKVINNVDVSSSGKKKGRGEGSPAVLLNCKPLLPCHSCIVDVRSSASVCAQSLG